MVIGANITLTDSRKVTFYGKEYRVAARLARTGTGLDSAVYTNMTTIREMAENAARLLETSPFKGVKIGTAASCLMINVADGYQVSDVADDINIHITRVEATPAKNMVSEISEGLGRVSSVIGVLIGALWILALVILIVAFIMISNERKKEFGVLRVMGASRSMLSRVNGTEAGILSLAGAAAGVLLAGLFLLPFTGAIRKALELPYLSPGPVLILVLMLAAILLASAAGVITAQLTAGRITGSETGLLLREEG